jgi:hypothetical protein
MKLGPTAVELWAKFEFGFLGSEFLALPENLNLGFWVIGLWF